MDNRKLIDKALEAMNYAYAPYSKKVELRHLLQMELFIPVAILKIVLWSYNLCRKMYQKKVVKAIKIFKNSHCKFIRDFTPTLWYLPSGHGRIYG